MNGPPADGRGICPRRFPCSFSILAVPASGQCLIFFLKNLEEKFGAKEKVLTFAVPSETHWFHEHGSLAQLVQSVCLTSRGSGVRLPQLPPQRTRKFSGSFFVSRSFSHFSFRLCRSRDWTEWTGTVWAAEATSDNEQVYFHIGKSN